MLILPGEVIPPLLMLQIPPGGSYQVISGLRLPAPAGQLCGHQPASVHQEQEHQGPDRRDRPAQAPRREEDGTQALVTAAGTGQSL